MKQNFTKEYKELLDDIKEDRLPFLDFIGKKISDAYLCRLVSGLEEDDIYGTYIEFTDGSTLIIKGDPL